MKLSKSGNIVVLHFAITMLSTTNLKRTVCQEIPVDVQSSEDIPMTLPPTLGTPDVNMVCKPCAWVVSSDASVSPPVPHFIHLFFRRRAVRAEPAARAQRG